ncbi:RNA polymerase III subunit RPC82-domain-containing protein [Hypoxylon crocopeplum]|nr:RNA polymerase III subunit RPC82-domain-containing protein [Hypoxylon crocopeplum]
MLVTKAAAELCVLLISELYGQLPSRTFADLLTRGRSTVIQLAQHTSLNLRQVRHGLAVLIQLNLIFHHTDQDSGVTYYQANPKAAYNLVRIGKILDMVRTKYGSHAHTLVHEVFMHGHAKIGDLVNTLKDGHDARGETVNGSSHNGHNHVNGNGNVNGNSVGNGMIDLEIEDEDPDLEGQAYDSLAQLIAVGILEPLTPTMYQSPQDLKTAIEQEFLADYPTGIRGSKQTNEFDKSVRDKLRQIQGENARLKRKLEYEFMFDFSSKRRKLTNGTMSNTFAGERARYALLDELDTVLRVNYDKCAVELRNLKLERYVEDFVGDTTARVYATLLAVLSQKVSRCQVDKATEVEDDDGDLSTGPRVTTQEVFEHLSPSIDVSAGIGVLHEEGAVDIRVAEKIRKYPPQLKGSTLQETLEEGEEIIGSDDEDYDHSGEAAIEFGLHGQNGSNEVGMQVDDGVPVGTKRLHQMRQHLLILAESNQGFVRHCGARDFGEWTVDFEPLAQHLKFQELDTLIENRFGRQGLRLTRILREKGKIDDKALPGLALMKKADVHVKMAEMEMAGFLDVQEVPRDNIRSAARTIFFWFFDLEKTMQRTLDNTYKSMVRCLQRLDVERRKKKNMLSVVERKDVQGMEEEKLRGDIYNEYVQFLDIEKKLFGQVARLDDIVAVFRDY